jgi:tyrosine-protein phosphatase YwqE
MNLNPFQSKVKPDLSFIGIDMHSHLLPGLDDGLQELEQSVFFIKKLHSLGYKKLICTPHIISDVYPNSPETILPKLALVREALKQNNVPVEIEAAAEYMVDTEMEKNIAKDAPLLTFGKNLILIEMSYAVVSVNIEKVIFDLRMKGYQPVLAHPERYNYYHNRFEVYERFTDLGCLLQINLLSLLGYYGKAVQKTAERLLKKKMVDLLGTDMHHEMHLKALYDLASKKNFYKLFEYADIKNRTLLG